VYETPDVVTPVKRFDRVMRYTYDIKFEMLQVRKNEISLRICWWFCAFAHVRGNTGHQGVSAI